MAEFNEKEIGKFLEKVDQVESLIKDLASGDSNLEQQAAKEADKFLGKHKNVKTSTTDGFEKTHITKYQEESLSKLDHDGLKFDKESVSPEEFMKRVEKDAAERRNRKEEDNKRANELKERGNKAFKGKEYTDAVKYYTEAIAIVKDNAVFYTNRAQAYIHIGNHELALDDCRVAQKIDSKCVKAYIHQGRALQNLEKFDEAIKSFEHATKIDKKYAKLVRDYIEEVEKRREISNNEQKSENLKISGDDRAQIMTDTVSRLRKGGLSISDLCKKLEELKKICDEEVYRTLFRTCGGFKIVAENPTISKLLKSTSEFKEEEQSCVFEILNLLSHVCIDNAENTEELLSPSFHSYLQKFIKPNLPSRIRAATVCLSHNISQLAVGREFVLQGGESMCILDELLSILTANDETSMVAIGAINNLALCDKLPAEMSAKICEKFSNFVVTMMGILSSMPNESQKPLSDSLLSLVSKGISTITNLSKDMITRRKLAMNKDLWQKSGEFLVSCEEHLDDDERRDVIFSLLGLIMNISLADQTLSLEETKQINDCCCRLLTSQHSEIVQRSAGVINRLSTSCSDLVHHNLKYSYYKSFVTVLKGENVDAKNYIIKCIALCSPYQSDLASSFLDDKALENLIELLNSDAETACGNAALTLGNLASDPNVSVKLASTDVIQDLLRVATKDSYANTVRHNAAIAIGKLATSHHRHLERLRELHGLEILHEVLKANKLT
ncbi:tetratricopeptide repeat protein 12-like [Rhopilema esculentum]|uniref:tetratricopeptide repeat protein 12-like n=1 Tax=Rhopilema esculentum TaxID=499914 RepID=UPI0031DBF9F3|eukprot:gene16855-8328_t